MRISFFSRHIPGEGQEFGISCPCCPRELPKNDPSSQKNPSQLHKSPAPEPDKAQLYCETRTCPLALGSPGRGQQIPDFLGIATAGNHLCPSTPSQGSFGAVSSTKRGFYSTVWGWCRPSTSALGIFPQGEPFPAQFSWNFAFSPIFSWPCGSIPVPGGVLSSTIPS